MKKEIRMNTRLILASLMTAATLAACSSPTVLNLEDVGAQPTLDELNADNDSSLELSGSTGGLGNLLVRKIYDTNQNGKYDDGEQGIPDWGVRIVSVDANGNPDDAADIQVTPQGSQRWRGVNLKVPYGRYKIEELEPTATKQAGTSWKITGPTSRILNVSREKSVRAVEFAGVCLENGVLVKFPKIADFAAWKCRATFDLLPRIGSFSATPNQIQSGGSSALAWKVLDYSKLEITPTVGVVTGFNGSKNVSPANTTAYTLKATNGFGSRTANVSVNVGRSQAGIPDLSFGTAGRVLLTDILPFPLAQITVGAFSAQPDGKLLVAGGGFDITDSSFDSQRQFLVRLNSQGTIDNGFGSNGKVLTSSFNRSDSIHSVKVQPDGKIILIGLDSSNNLTLERFLGNGTVDTSFGTAGVVRQTQTVISRLLVRSDGKLLATTSNGMARFNQDGSIDAGFGINGVVVFGSRLTNISAEGIGLQSDGKVIVAVRVIAGATTINGNVLFKYDVLLVRYNNNGSLDTSFGNQGESIIDLGSDADVVNNLFLRTDGRLFNLGASNQIGSGLRVPENLYFQSLGNPNVLQPDGKRVILTRTSDDRYRLERYNTDGSKDNTLVNDGLIDTPDIPNLILFTISLQSDGKVLLGGFDPDLVTGLDPTSVKKVVLLRYHL
jgi:uncharacterized delta-60 repeat protein